MTAAAKRSKEPLGRISVFLYTRQIEALNEVNARTQIPVAALIRQGVDLILAQHGTRPTTATTAKRRGQR